jgi:shikimate dehydrogenase
MTGLLGVIGDPINHSLSPLIHNHWLREFGLPAQYEAMQVLDGELPAALQTLSAKKAIGLNVTLPHKHAALAASIVSSDTAKRIGAANTLTLQQNGDWHADNTDVPGFITALKLAGITALNTKSVLILGAGGSARAVLCALDNQNADIAVMNRTLERAEDICRTLTAGRAKAIPSDLSMNELNRFDIIINTTSLGYSGNHYDLPDGKDRLFFDISYGKAAAAQLAHAESQNWKTQDGLGMLVAQAAESFNIWFDEMPEIEPMLKRCRAIVEVTQ